MFALRYLCACTVNVIAVDQPGDALLLLFAGGGCM
jgi:hypothetical protein